MDGLHFAMCIKKFNVVKRVHNYLKKKKKKIHVYILILFSTAGGGGGEGQILFSEIYVAPGSCNL